MATHHLETDVNYIAINVEPAANGGLVIIHRKRPGGIPASKAPSIEDRDIYLCPSATPEEIGKVVLTIMAMKKLEANAMMDIEDIEF